MTVLKVRELAGRRDIGQSLRQRAPGGMLGAGYTQGCAGWGIPGDAVQGPYPTWRYTTALLLPARPRGLLHVPVASCTSLGHLLGHL